MRVLLSTTSVAPRYGGPAISVWRLAAALEASGAHVGLWVADGVRPDKTSALPLFTGNLEPVFARFGRPDVVHDNGLWLAHNHRLAVKARRRGIPVVLSPRGLLEPWALAHKAIRKGVAWRLYQRHDVNCAAALHATSELEAKGLSRLSLRPGIHIIPNGVEGTSRAVVEAAWARKRDPGRPASRHMLFLGRLHPVKGLTLLLDAWARVRPRRWRLSIAGPDEDGHRAELAKLVRRLGLDAEVSFLGPVEGAEKEALFLDADLFVLPSHQESFGLAAAEAMAHGLPAITTTGGPWQSLEAARAGWCVAASVPGLSAALADAAALSDDDRAQMGLNAHSLIDGRYSWPSVAARFLELYRIAGA